MKSIRIASLAAALLALPLAAHAQSNNNRWEGIYAGLNAGGLWTNTNATIVENNTYGSLNGNGGGVMGGAQAGYNWLLGPVLLGGEVDFQGSTNTTNLTGGAGPSNITATSAIPWFSTFRARAGYPIGSVMPYVTAGAVWGHQNLYGFDQAAGGSFSASNNFWTYAVGAGVEGHIAEAWTAKLEYLWIGTPDTALSSPASARIDERAIGNVVRVGLNYHF
jgi:outer membrane immunogenic protein